MFIAEAEPSLLLPLAPLLTALSKVQIAAHLTAQKATKETTGRQEAHQGAVVGITVYVATAAGRHTPSKARGHAARGESAAG